MKIPLEETMPTEWELAIAGMDKADRSAVFATELEKCAIDVGQRYKYFSMQTVRQEHPECHPRYYGLHNNAFGGQSRKWVKAGWCKPFEIVRGFLPGSHAHMLNRFESLIFKRAHRKEP
jgi:hypothetical protein